MICDLIYMLNIYRKIDPQIHFVSKYRVFEAVRILISEDMFLDIYPFQKSVNAKC